MSAESGITPCSVCGNISALMCQRCGEPYCNDVCQRKDWQRHKYFCIIMPPLVSLRPIKPVAVARHESVCSVTPRALNHASSKSSMDSILNEAIGGSNNCPSDVSEASKCLKLSTAWREHENPPENDFFDCLVTYIERDASFWVVAESNTERLERLTLNMVRSMQKRKPCSFEEIAIGDLVAVSSDQKMYRAEVLALDANEECVQVRLIDYGAVATVDARDVYLAVPRMAEIKAYAFRVMLSAKSMVEVNKRLTLCLLGSNNIDGVYQVQQKFNKTIPLHLPIQLLNSNPEVILIKTFKHSAALKEPKMYLLQIKQSNNLNNELNSHLSNKSCSNFTEPFPEKLRTFFLAAHTKEGYRRAFLIDFIEQPSRFLVYEMDEGRISITDEVRRIPQEFLDHPLGVFAATLPYDSQSLSLTKSDDELTIKFHEDERHNHPVRVAKASLMSNNNEEVCTVCVCTFMGRIAEMGLKIWEESIENGSLVYISHIENYHTICISSVETKEYSDIFKSLESKCLPFGQNSAIPIGSIVLVVSTNRGYYRGEVISDWENGHYKVRNIDTDTALREPAANLRKSCAFLENLPVSQCRASIKIICSIPPDAVPSNTTALRLLKNLFEQKTELKVQFTDEECNSLDLLDESSEPASLVARMLPMMFTPTAVDLKPAQSLPAAPPVVAPEVAKSSPVVLDSMSIVGLPSLPPSPPDTPCGNVNSSKQTKRYYFEDLKRELLPIGDSFKILVLNAIGLHKTGHITACFFSSEQVAESFQDLLNQVADIGSDNAIQPGYQPDVGEMCLALFAEDNSWYRGVCLRVKSNAAEILYCDFGNSEILPLDRIKPIPIKLLQPVYATKCFIFGFDNSKNFMALEEYLAAKNNIMCSVLEGSEPNTRLVKIPTLDKILSRELN